MSPLRVGIADDEPLARKRLARLLTDAGCDVVCEWEDGASLVEGIRDAPEMDALFLDIQMPGATGFEVVAELENVRTLPKLVFVTSHPEHALRAFDADAVDYLLKPVTAERLERALKRLDRSGARSTSDPRPTSSGLRFPAKAGEGHVILDLRKTTHFELDNDIVWAWCLGKRYRTSWRSLSEVEDAFPTVEFLRIQRQVLLRPEAVIAVKPLFGGRSQIRIGDGIDLEVSRSATPRLKERLGMG